MKFHDYRMVFLKNSSLSNSELCKILETNVFSNTIHKELRKEGENVILQNISSKGEYFFVTIVDVDLDLSSKIPSISKELKELTAKESNGHLSFSHIDVVDYECPLDFNPCDIKDTKVNSDWILLMNEDKNNALFIMNSNIKTYGKEISLKKSYGFFKRQGVLPRQAIVDNQTFTEIFSERTRLPVDKIQFLS